MAMSKENWPLKLIMMKPNDDDLKKSILILCSVFPPIGFFLFFIHRNQSPAKARKALGSALIGVPIGLLMGRFVIPFFKSIFFD